MTDCSLTTCSSVKMHYLDLLQRQDCFDTCSLGVSPSIIIKTTTVSSERTFWHCKYSVLRKNGWCAWSGWMGFPCCFDSLAGSVHLHDRFMLLLVRVYVCNNLMLLLVELTMCYQYRKMISFRLLLCYCKADWHAACSFHHRNV